MSAPSETISATHSAEQGDQLSTAKSQNPPSPEVTDSLTPSLPSKVGKITFDPNGDVILVIPSGSDPSAVARFQANSVVLCLASPVFRAMLGPNSRFREGTNLKLAAVAGGLQSSGSNSTPMELSLTDDDPDAFAVILRILHLDFDNIPTAMSAFGTDEEQYKLHEMAIICDKYDMRHVLLFWLKLWTAPYLKTLNFNNIAMSSKTGTRWLFIAYAFGYERLFHSVSRELILHCHLRSSGELFLLSPKINMLDTFYLPQSITDEISAKRQQAMEAIVDTINNEIEQYSNPRKTHCQFGEPSCDAMILGLLFRNCREIQIYPEASVITTQSVEEVKSILKMIQFPKYLPINKLTGCCRKPLQIQTTLLFGGTSATNPAPGGIQPGGMQPGGMQPGTSAFGGCMSTTTGIIFGQTTAAKLDRPGVVKRDSTCSNCQNPYQAPTGPDINHAEYCLPLTRLKKALDDIVGKVTGLEYSQFVRNDSDGKQATPAKQVFADLWSTVYYTEVPKVLLHEETSVNPRVSKKR
ncbi:hypothetical protein L211DRAFT_839299 [Terfezia boudieri ATCC MYA-4762]|uniref:BTB domain-containing protein n=1 Tax=Terfezia boudieri ATCC MYA-4762 TaxID=1051890 RepID=A0A3N4LJC4_9PEZI|nr:hypothetical protein L211DRAFT_839299 [Terfezia boudieri ATCC MYA-4762]